MSQENIEIVRAVMEAQRRRDWGAFSDLYDPEIEWEDVSGLWGDWGTRRGFDDVRDAFVTLFEAFEEVDFDAEDLLERDDVVVSAIRMRARGRASGVLVEQRIATLVWNISGGRVVRVRAYRERSEALEAAGLAE